MVVYTPPIPTVEELDAKLMLRNVEFTGERYFHEAWNFVRPNLLFFILSMLMWVAIGVAVFFVFIFFLALFGLDREEKPHPSMWAALLGHLLGQLVFAIVLGTPIIAGYYNAVFQAMRTNQYLRYRHLFVGWGCPYFVFLAGLTALLFVCRTVLFFALIIPGIWFTVASMFAIPLHLDHANDLGAFRAMRLSCRVVTRHWCRMFALLFCLGLLQIAGALCLLVGLFVTMPTAFVTIIYCYHHLIGVNGVPVLVPIHELPPQAQVAVVQPMVVAQSIVVQP